MKALQLYRSFKSSTQPILKIFQKPTINPNLIAYRYRVTTETGAVLPHPAKRQFGLLRVFGMVLPGLYLGATISKEGAAFLEENDIFVPDEDDDED